MLITTLLELVCHCREAGFLEAAALHFAHMLFVDRLRTPTDRRQVVQLMDDILGHQPDQQQRPAIAISPEALQIGWACLPRAASAQQSAAAPGMCSICHSVQDAMDTPYGCHSVGRCYTCQCTCQASSQMPLWDRQGTKLRVQQVAIFLGHATTTRFSSVY